LTTTAKAGRLPSLPHGEARLRSSEPRRAEGRQREQRNRLKPKKVELSESERISTSQMERDFKAALKADKKRQSRRRQNPFRRLLNTIKSWLRGSDEKKKAAKRKDRGGRGRADQGPRERKGDGKDRPERRGGKRHAPGHAAKKGADGRGRKKRRNPKGGRDPGARQGGPHPSRKDGQKSGPDGSHKSPPPKDSLEKKTGEKPAAKAPSDAAKSGAGSGKKRRNRRNRSRRNPSDSSGPASHEG
jgi:hypothetical protein